MQNFQDNFETRKRSFISAFSICITVTLMIKQVFQQFLKITETYYYKE